jgi:hypothetical protein
VGLNLPKNQNLILKTPNLAKLTNPSKASTSVCLTPAPAHFTIRKTEIQGLRQNFDSFNLVGINKTPLSNRSTTTVLDHIKKI